MTMRPRCCWLVGSNMNFVLSSPILHQWNRISLTNFTTLRTKRRYASKANNSVGRHKARINSKFKVDIATLGKKSTKDSVYDDAISEYKRRLTGMMDIQERFIKRELAVSAFKDISHHGHSIIVLDVRGKLPSNSVEFSKSVFNSLQAGRSHLTFFIGDAEGYPEDVIKIIKNERNLQGIDVISLSTLTLTHKMVRLLLYEQLYRAAEIRNNTKYHK